MKLINHPTCLFGKKTWAFIPAFILFLILPQFPSSGQTISLRVNSYFKAQVKETAIRGTILVAENMTDWLSQTQAAPAVPKKTPAATSGKPIKVVYSGVKTKNTFAVKPTKS